ncbi:MAG: carboxylating nicotinate-nucleotide diphosphorylase [Candidatus Eisenbacteria bacterium]|jgi:nicotinate-nucleotide pyrophosphorylase (carboxylating)|nr:carboxylating nicotinate-nucleotide diphosphorylase [Candidatus Eisenbacteria bacterium]
MSADKHPDPVEAARVVAQALIEDLGTAGDLTTAALVPVERRARGSFIARDDGVMAGAPMVDMVYRLLGTPIRWDWSAAEGARFRRGDVLGSGSGPAHVMLTGERVALNFLQRLSGVATHTRRFADEVAGTDVVLLDTRKTTPGLRCLERYAVRVGGGKNHRMGLYDRVLIKDNHLAVAGSPSQAVRVARRTWPSVPIEIEVRTLAEFRDACTESPEWVLLDNMDLAGLRECVRERDVCAPPRPRLEASGGVRLDTVRAVALTGVDAVSIGALTHGATWIDIALEVEL